MRQLLSNRREKNKDFYNKWADINSYVNLIKCIVGFLLLLFSNLSAFKRDKKGNNKKKRRLIR